MTLIAAPGKAPQAPAERCRTDPTRLRRSTRWLRRSFVLPVSTPYDRRHGLLRRARTSAGSQERKRNFCPVLALVIFGDGVGTRSEVGRSGMSLPDPAEHTKHNVVRLGTETLFAIAEQLRRMYDADLRTKPSEELERLMRRIERGEDVP